MRRKKRFQPNRPRKQGRAAHVPAPLAPRAERAPALVYGKPFTLLEDEHKATFQFSRGSWVPYAMTIAECLENSCQVKELPQKVNRMTRYEVRCPLGG
jgi:hypothetical protein